MTKPAVLLQILSFSAIGIAATLTHVAVAWIAFEEASLTPILANLLGAIAAFFFSFLCNAKVTFRSRQSILRSGPRYLAVSLVSWLLASGIMLFVESRELPTYLYALAVLIIVPPTTFLLAKFWVFGIAQEQLTNDMSET